MSAMSNLAMQEHLLEGHPLSLFEAMAMFGVANPAAELTRMRKDGYVLKSRRVTMSRIAVRLKKVCGYIPPKNLPHREIHMMEYWIEK